MPKSTRNKRRPTHQPRPRGWLTSDADELERRRLRAANEAFEIEPLDGEHPFFTRLRVRSEGAQEERRVEIRSLLEPINSCDCPDQRINRLGSCKHIEACLLWLQHRRKRAFQAAARQGSPYIEIFLDQRDRRVHVAWPQTASRRSKSRQLLEPFFDAGGVLLGEPLDALPPLERAVAAAHGRVRRGIRISRELGAWLERLDRQAQLQRDRQHFESEVAAGRASLDLVRHRLYPYQQEGMLHLAFTGRALLADEMGLGKTVQAVAACELLRRTRAIHRVLVVSPASLKGEWREQIDKFTELQSQIVQGARARRLRQYRQAPFFTLVSYEQARSDAAEINQILAPDVVILDEAQRIKNWQTKTAVAVKQLRSPYAFVLTGTPLENRIDEIYSITQFLDPDLLGPLFRFNREFYQLDDKGHAIGYCNLDRLHARLRPVMLRRRKEEVEGQLPGRTLNSYFVPMHKEQRLRYEEYEAKVARLAAIAQRRALTQEELQLLQLNLSCMRMLCDTPFILDQACRISPKLQELANILREILADGEHKIIVFSEWERMLQLVRDEAEGLDLGYAWHTGKIPQPKRRTEIQRFKQDPACRLFLSTDSGAVGLNLQVADVVINLDIPWNPAKLEQRIARAWRKHQKRPVQVINLVTENSIEQRMLGLLQQKRALAAGVIDGKGESEMSLPSGRAAFMEKIEALMGGEGRQAVAAADPFERLGEGLATRWGPRLRQLELHGEGAERTLLLVVDRLDDDLRELAEGQLEALYPEQTPRLQILDQAGYAAVQQLLEAGLLSINQEGVRRLYQPGEEPKDEQGPRRQAEARELLGEGDHQRRMARLLCDGGFRLEALPPLRDALEIGLRALALWRGEPAEAPLELGRISSQLVGDGLLPAGTVPLITRLRDPSSWSAEQAQQLFEQGDELLERAASLLGVV